MQPLTPMPNWFPVKGQTYIVLGLGRSGLATIRWLKEQGAFSIAIDDNMEKVVQAQKAGAIAFSSEDILWHTVAALIASPGIPLTQPQCHPLIRQARQNNVPIIGEGDLFALSHPAARLIGITGTNGKSTTTALVGHILKQCGTDCQVGGNIGTPLLDLPPGSLYVLELSSYQLDLYQLLNLNVAGWLNIAPDHLDRHGTMENYVEAKKRIFKTGRSNPVAVIGIDDPVSEKVWQELSQAQAVIPVSVNRPLDRGISVQWGWLKENGETIFNMADSPTLKGLHNHQNAAIAYGICRALNISRNDILQGLQSFPGLAHRQEFICTLEGIDFINDSKGTNAEATAKALATFDQIYWIAGGKAKSDGIDSLLPFFPKIRHSFLIGDAQNRFAETLEGKVPYTRAGTLEQAVRQAYQLARNAALVPESSGSVILLSPACASFDQFQDFEHRGDVFRKLVWALEAER